MLLLIKEAAFAGFGDLEIYLSLGKVYGGVLVIQKKPYRYINIDRPPNNLSSSKKSSCRDHLYLWSICCIKVEISAF